MNLAQIDHEIELLEKANPLEHAPTASLDLETRFAEGLARGFKAVLDRPRDEAAINRLRKLSGLHADVSDVFLFGMLVPLVAELRAANDRRKAAVDELQARVVALEARPQMKYCGVYDATRAYESGDVVTCSGSMWVAKGHTVQRPDELGAGARDWTLAVKRGRDGRDVR